MRGPVYYYPKLNPRMALNDRRVRAMHHAGPWASCAHKGGSLVFWRVDGQNVRPPNLSEYAEPRAIDESGALYYSPRELPSQEDLAKGSANSMDASVTLSNGMLVTVACALAAPRHIDFALNTVGNYSDDFGIQATQLYEKMASDDAVTITDPLVLNVMFLGLAQRYRLTKELLNDLQWVCTDDVDPIVSAVMYGNSDPKSESAGAA